MINAPDIRAVMEREMAGSVELSPRWVRVKAGGETIAESKTPVLLIQFGPSILPTYFFTKDEVQMGALDSPNERDGKRFWTVNANGQRFEDAAWTYADPPEHLAALKERVTFSWELLDWYEEGEQVFVHARNPHKRVDTIASIRHVQVMFGGEVIADTQRPHLLFETWLPTRYYIPQEDIRMEYLYETEHVSMCPYKGTARYWTLRVGDQMLENGAWSYPNPILENPKIKDLVAFYNEYIDIYVDGQLMPRPWSPWAADGPEGKP